MNLEPFVAYLIEAKHIMSTPRLIAVRDSLEDVFMFICCDDLTAIDSSQWTLTVVEVDMNDDYGHRRRWRRRVDGCWYELAEGVP